MRRNHIKHDQINGTCAIASNNRSWPLIQSPTEHRLLMLKWKNEQNYNKIGRESTEEKKKQQPTSGKQQIDNEYKKKSIHTRE